MVQLVYRDTVGLGKLVYIQLRLLVHVPMLTPDNDHEFFAVCDFNTKDMPCNLSAAAYGSFCFHLTTLLSIFFFTVIITSV